MTTLLAFLASLSWTVGFWYLYLVRVESAQVRARLHRLFALPTPQTTPLHAIRNWLNQFALAQQAEPLLKQAGLSITPADYLLIQGASMVLLAFVLARLLGLSLLSAFSIAMPAIAGGARLALLLKRGNISTQVTQQLPEAVRMLGNALHAGLSVRQGLALVAQEAQAPLGPLFQRTVDQLQLGSPLEEALDEVVARVASRDLQLVVTTILLQCEVGGDLAGALDDVATALVERTGVEGEVRTATAEQRYVAMVLPIIPVAGVLLLNLGHPGYIQVLTRPLGITLLIFSLSLQGLGFFLIHRTARIMV